MSKTDLEKCMVLELKSFLKNNHRKHGEIKKFEKVSQKDGLYQYGFECEVNRITTVRIYFEFEQIWLYRNRKICHNSWEKDFFLRRHRGIE